jgi:predicted dehydrogenase
MVRIGIMSFAHMHAYSYAACVNAIDGAVLTAVWDDDAKRGRAAAKEFGTEFRKSAPELLGPDVDAVIVCSENVKHRDSVEMAAAAGKWILCEKPLATTVADAKAMVAVCKKAKVGLGTAFPCRYATTLIDARRRVRSGEIGTLYAAACTNNGQFPGGWFADEALAGGGATMDHTVHVVDLLRWITGNEFTRVFCEKGNLLHKNINTDDVGSVHLEMDDGLKVSHVASWNRPKSFPTWGDVTIEFIGSKGVMNVDAFNQKLDLYRDQAMRHEWAPWGDDANRALIEDFVNAVRDRREPSVSGVDGLRAVEITVAAYASANKGAMVRI